MGGHNSRAEIGKSDWKLEASTSRSQRKDGHGQVMEYDKADGIKYVYSTQGEFGGEQMD